MPVAGAVSLTLSKQALGYDDLDTSGDLSPGDRVHYRVDYGNNGPEDVTGARLRDQPDAAHIASVEAITGGGTFDGTGVEWDIGTLAAGASGSVTYDALLKDALAFVDSTTTSTAAAPSTAENPVATEGLATTTTGTTESYTTTMALIAAAHDGDDGKSDDGQDGHDGESDDGHGGDPDGDPDGGGGEPDGGGG